jgi:quercetin dioxygenase-like cupin family protein
MKEHFARTGDAKHSTADADAPHPLMHRTETIDYGIVIEGEITLIVDKGETALTRGDVIIQRGTNHAWANRSDKTCRMLFILVDGAFAPELQG